MARVRLISPAFFDNERLGVMDPLARLLFIGLWCMADREGRLEDRPLRLKKQILSWDTCDIDALLDALAEDGFIVRYEADGERYIAIPKFLVYQRPHSREVPSPIPPPPDVAANSRPRHDLGRASASPRTDHSSVQTMTSPPNPYPYPYPDPLTDPDPDPHTQGGVGGTAPAAPAVRVPEPATAGGRSATTGTTTTPRYSADFERFWTAYPRKEAKPTAWAAWQKLRPDADTLRAIGDGLERWRRSDQWGRGVYQHPSTWINRRQWEDEPATAEARAAAVAPERPRRPSVAEVSRQALDLLFGDETDTGSNGHGIADVPFRVVDAGGDLARALERPRAG